MGESSNDLNKNTDAIIEPVHQDKFEVSVETNNIERAMKMLKRKLIREGFYKQIKQRRYFEKPCEARKRKGKEAAKRIKKEKRKAKKLL